jgi:hypothetical protein
MSEGVEAPGPVLGLLAHHHPHGDPIRVAARPDPDDAGYVLVAVKGAGLRAGRLRRPVLSRCAFDCQRGLAAMR